MKTKATGTPDKKHLNTTRQQSPHKETCHRSLKSRRIFLDLRGYNGASTLETKLRFLGAVSSVILTQTIEKCFSRDVNYVITSRGAAADYRGRHGHRGGATGGGGEGASSPAVPSPFSAGGGARSGGATTDSPRTESPRPPPDGCSRPMTRGKAIAQKANLTKNYGSTDVLESARKWNMKIVHVEQAQSWVTRELEKLPADVTQSMMKEKTKEKKKPYKVRRLRCPFIKFESSTGQFRPVERHFAVLPSLAVNAAATAGPFAGPSTGGQHLLERAEVGEVAGLYWHDTTHSSSSSSSSSSSGGEGGVRGRPPRKGVYKRVRISGVYGRGGGGAEASQSAAPPGDVHGAAPRRQPAAGQCRYCELCHVKCDSVNKHARSDRHRELVRDAATFASLDRRIAMGADLDHLRRTAAQ